MNEVQDASRFDREIAEFIIPDPINPKARAMEIIDTDFHLSPSWDRVRPYLKEPFRSKLYHYPATSAEYTPEPANNKPGMGQNALGTAETGEDVLHVIDEIGVDTVIIAPGFNRPQSIFNETVVAAISSAFNDYVAEQILPVSDRIKASIMICHRDPALGAAEIRRMAPDNRFVSVYTEFGACYEPLGCAKYDPIFEALGEFDLPLTIHAGGFYPHWSPLFTGARTWTELLGNASMAGCMAHVSAMIMQGLFDKFPDQKILVQEGGLWWIPDLMLRLDGYYLDHPGDIALTERKLESGEEFLNRLPSEYLLDNFVFSTQPIHVPKNAKHFGYLLEMCHAEDLFCYSSDWPHQTFDPPNWVVESPDIIDEAMQRKIFSENAKRAYPRLYTKGP